MVVSRQTIPPNGQPSRLMSCQNGDLLELLEIHPQEGTALARRSLQPQNVGLIPLDNLVRTVKTLENVAIQNLINPVKKIEFLRRKGPVELQIPFPK